MRDCRTVTTIIDTPLPGSTSEIHSHAGRQDRTSEDNKQDCAELRVGAEQIKDQAVADAKTYADSSACLAAVNSASVCAGDKAYENPICPQFCASPMNINDPRCDPNACARDANKNTLMCFCQGNPQDSKCGGLQAAGPLGGGPGKNGLGSAPGSRANLGTTPAFDLGDGDGDDQEYQGGASAAPKAQTVGYEGQGGGGLSGGGGGLGGSMGGQGKGKQEGPYNTDIMKSSGGGGYAGFGGGGGGGYGAGNNGGGNGRDRDRGDGLDLRKYMPKAGDKGRGPANISAELFNNGITPANGMSNFEKVTKKMNEKRTQLLP
jgi:hypothetical protein